MNAKTLIAAVALALGTASAFAVEATRISIDAPLLNRAEVRAELARASAAGEMNMRSESYGSFTASDIASTPTSTPNEIQTHVVNAATGDYIGG